MFQRLKGAIDNRIAEEQARQRQAQQAAQTRQPPRRRPQNANTTPRPLTSAEAGLSTEKGPDPKDFEPEFVIGDADSKASSIKDEVPSEEKEAEGGTTDEPAQSATTTPENATDNGSIGAVSNAMQAERQTELPADVRVKLRKLERMELKYGELLKAYRTAHARVQVIEPFEATLRENTPLASIADPGALVEYLNQTKLKGDMVLEELKRVTNEKDDYKKRLEQSEKNVTQLTTKVTDLEAEIKATAAKTQEHRPEHKNESPVSEDKSPTSPKTNELNAESATKSRIPSISMFSPRLGSKKEPEVETSEDLFSYDSEVPRLESELQERTAQVEELNKEVERLRTDLKVTRESTEGMTQTLEERTKEVDVLRDTNASFESDITGLKKRIQELETAIEAAKAEAETARSQLKELEAQQTSGTSTVEAQNDAKEAWAARETELQTQVSTLKNDVDLINEKLSQKGNTLKDLEASLALAKKKEQDFDEHDKSTEKKMKVMNGIMDNIKTQLDKAQGTISDLKKELENQKSDFARQPSTRIFSFLDDDQDLSTGKIEDRDDAIRYLTDRFGLAGTGSVAAAEESQASEIAAGATAVANSEASATSGKKKNNKKKKKGANTQTSNGSKELDRPIKVSETVTDTHEETAVGDTGSLAPTKLLEEEINKLKSELNEKDATIDRLSGQIKSQDDLREEIETLRDDLLHQGQEHVDARDALKKAQEQRSELQSTVKNLETELEHARKQISQNGAIESAHKDLMVQFDELKLKSSTVEKDLKAAEQLATARFKDISDLKELLTKAQPELRSLRSEVAELKSAKDELKNKQGEITRLESKFEDHKSEMKGLSRRLGDKDNDIKTLQQKIEQESRARAKVEDELTSTQSDLRVAENKRTEANERAAQTSKEFTKAREDAAALRSKLRDLEDKISKHLQEISNLKEDVSLKGALHASSQSLVQSLRDQTHELSTQTREATARTENLEEELSEAQRMLSERTREGQTMRTLLNQTESGTESRVREMRERMEAAVEERDRVEDEANVASRRMMREVEDARNKARDSQRQLKIIENERDELESKSRSWRRAREELEHAIESAKLEVTDVRTAMKELREALDESERQIREAEIHKQDYRKQTDEAAERIDKLIKANKSLSEEIKALQSGAARKGSIRPTVAVAGPGSESGLQSSRGSMDSPTARSPAPPLNRAQSRSGTPLGAGTATGPNVGLSQAPVDYVYLKNVLLQFLERKDKAHQRQLIPVLGMLLHFNREEEQKFVSAISAR